MQKYTTNQTGFFYNIVESKYTHSIVLQFHFVFVLHEQTNMQ